ncbi:hypothetical protein KY312_02150, partial [Candidatus Woesearchaeota archaeon]|nr:hypothetical protein [Candidatus Woesearchaeota archaeon]
EIKDELGDEFNQRSKNELEIMCLEKKIEQDKITSVEAWHELARFYLQKCIRKSYGNIEYGRSVMYFSEFVTVDMNWPEYTEKDDVYDGYHNRLNEYRNSVLKDMQHCCQLYRKTIGFVDEEVKELEKCAGIEND